MVRVRSTRGLKKITAWQELTVACMMPGMRYRDSDGRVATIKTKTRTHVWFEVQFEATCELRSLTNIEFVDRFYQDKL